MLGVNIALNLYNITVCLILLLHLWINRQNYNKTEKSSNAFICMCLFNILMTVGDTMMWLFEGFRQPWYPIALSAGTLIYYGSSMPILLAFAGYLFACYPIDEKVRKLLWRGAVSLCFVQLILSVLSYRFGIYFYIDAYNIYHRGDWFMLAQVIAGFLLFLDAVLIIVYRKKIGNTDAISLFSYILLFAVAHLIQIFNYGIALTNVGISISLLIIFTNIQSRQALRIEQKEHELTDSRISIMLSQIQPHFLYNALTAIGELCMEDPQTARIAVSEFSGYLRGNLDSLTIKQLITFDRELRHVETYLSLEKKRFENKLKIEYDIPVRDFTLPALTLQPVVENAVRHGIIKRSGRGTVTISTKESDDVYLVIVTDDGIGFNPSDKPADDGRSHIGIENVRSRLASMCGGTLTVESTPGKGTTVTIAIPK